MGEYNRKGFGLKETGKPLLEAAYASRVRKTFVAVPQARTSVQKYTRDRYPSIIHAKYNADAPIATSSLSRRYPIVHDITEADYICDYIHGKGNRYEFLQKLDRTVSP